MADSTLTPPNGWSVADGCSFASLRQHDPGESEFVRQFQRRMSPSQSLPEDGQILSVARRTPKMARLEAVLLVSDVALPPRRLAQLATLADPTEARTLVNRLNDAYDRCGTPFRVERVAAGYRMFTRAEYALWLGKLHQREVDWQLSPSALETLTIIAYRQPLTRADIEAIRGVQCAEMLKQLMDRGLVRIGGEDDSLGRPFLYETTRKFLESFGLRDLDDLPLATKLRRPDAKKSAEGESEEKVEDRGSRIEDGTDAAAAV